VSKLGEPAATTAHGYAPVVYPLLHLSKHGLKVLQATLLAKPLGAGCIAADVALLTPDRHG
jgi:hypothetical protein